LFVEAIFHVLKHASYPLLLNGVNVNLFGENTDTVRNNAAALAGAIKKICPEANSEII
jgi:hypothetical protein